MTPNDWNVVFPMLALAAGSLLCILSGAFFQEKRLGGNIAILSIAAAFLLQARIWNLELGPVFEGLYISNSFTGLLGALFLLLTALAWGFSSFYLEEGDAADEFFAILLVAPIGMLFMAGAQNLLLLFLGVEILSIPLYFLCAFRKNRLESIESGLKYFLLGTFAAAFLLFGISLLYAASGSLDLGTIFAQKDSLIASQNGLFTAGLGLILVGLLFKASIAPFHFWTPDVYEGAPTPVTAYMAGATKAAAFGALFRVAVLFPENMIYWLGVAALLTLFVGNLGALVQTSVKRMLAYSGIAHAGILLIAIAAMGRSEGARSAVLFYLIAYGFTVAGAFGLMAHLEKLDGEKMTRYEGFQGLARRRPFAAALMALFLLSLAGIPPTAGFLGKYLVFAAAIETKSAWLIFLAIAGILFSVVSLGYYLRVLVQMYMMQGEEPSAPAKGLPFYALVATGTAAGGVILFGVLPNVVLDLIQ